MERLPLEPMINVLLERGWIGRGPSISSNLMPRYRERMFTTQTLFRKAEDCRGLGRMASYSAQGALKPGRRTAEERVPRRQPRDQGGTVIRGPSRSGFICAPRLIIDALGIAGTELPQSYSDRLGVFPSIEELFAFVVGRPTAVIAGVPAGWVRIGFRAESDTVRHRRFLPKKRTAKAGFRFTKPQQTRKRSRRSVFPPGGPSHLSKFAADNIASVD